MDSCAALLADLLGYDPDAGAEVPSPAPVRLRPTIAEAMAGATPGQVVAARDGQTPVAVVVTHDGAAFAVADRCPHDGGWLSDGWVEGDRLVCARHGWEICASTGACDQRPQEVVPVRRLAVDPTPR